MMRAKMRLVNVENGEDGEKLTFTAVSKSEGYPADGSDENNTYATWTPSADLSMWITNPSLYDRFKTGQEFYLDFTKVE